MFSGDIDKLMRKVMDIQGPTGLKSYLQWGSGWQTYPKHKDSSQLLNEAFKNNALFLNMNRNLMIIW